MHLFILFTAPLNKADRLACASLHWSHDWYCNADVVIVPIPMSADNYCYLIIDELNKTAVLIDAADPEAVQVK